MPILNLDKLFYPRAVAVIGASNREAAPGHIVMQNLLQGGFEGPIMPVSPDDRAIAGVLAYPAIDDLPETPDLAVVCDGRDRMPAAIRALGERGTRAAILLGDGAVPQVRSGGGLAHRPLLQEAERYGLRILGPDCLGLMVPHIGLNASVAPAAAVPGGVAFVSQSSTVCAAILDWARERDIGFSHFISLGQTADIDFGDVIDYLGNDAMTRAILLYIESIKSGRKFMSAGRGASRNKPILVIKAGRTPEGQRAAFGTADAAVADAVYDSAIRRAGMLRVHRFGELFAAVETLGRSRPLKGERLAIVSNGIGIAVMAVDSLVLSGGRLAPLTEDCRQALTPLFSGRSGDNPVHLAEDAPPDHYAAAVKTLIASQRVDAVMVLHAPSSAVSSSRIADAVIRAAKEARGSVLASFMGGQRVAEARRLFAEARIPSFDTVNEAVEAFMHMVRYRRNQDMLIETPASMPAEFSVDADAARLQVANHLRHGRSILTGADAEALLATYGIPSAQVRTAASPHEAANAAVALGFPVRLRLQADGGTDTEDPAPLTSRAAVLAAAERLLANQRRPLADGKAARLLIERGLVRRDGHEARIGVVDDPVFGPVITFGQGGETADVLDDRAVALPPLNAGLARELISRTRLYQLLRGYGSRPPANLDALCLTLVRISQIVVDVPEIAAIDINPVLVNEHGVCAGASQILIAPATEMTEQRLAIRPYPKELEEPFTLVNGRTVLLRPIRPEDEPAHYEMLSKCTPEDMRLRFFHPIRTLPHTEMARLTQIDYDREMAFLVTAPRADGSGPETLGVVRTVTDLSNDKAEYAILVRSDMKGQRLGWKLMEKMVRYCRSRGTRRIVGQVLRDNVRMLDLVASLGFRRRKVLDEDLMEVELNLQEPVGPAPGH